MSTLSQLQTARAAAGVRYTAAVNELTAAYCDLASIEACLSNSNVGGGDQRTFTAIPEKFAVLYHPIYAATPPTTRIVDQVAAGRDVYIANFTKG